MPLSDQEARTILEAKQAGIISIHELDMAEEMIHTRGLAVFNGFCKARTEMQEREAEAKLSRLLGTPLGPLGH